MGGCASSPAPSAVRAEATGRSENGGVDCKPAPAAVPAKPISGRAPQPHPPPERQAVEADSNVDPPRTPQQPSPSGNQKKEIEPVEAPRGDPPPEKPAPATETAAGPCAIKTETGSIRSAEQPKMLQAQFKVGEEVFYQTKNSHPLPAKVESVNYPDAGEGPDAEVTYSIDIYGRKRETVQSRLRKKDSASKGPPAQSTQTLALPPPPPAPLTAEPTLAIEAGPPKSAALALTAKPPGSASTMSRPTTSSSTSVPQKKPKTPAKVLPVTDGPFVASYDWQEVGPRSVPPGMDVKTFLDGSSPTIARIPPEWRLQVDVNGDCYHRMDVTRDMPLQDIVNAILQERFKGSDDYVVTMKADGVQIEDPESTVESAALFGKKIYATVEKS